VKISVSITTFNHERFIRQAVESVLGQYCGADVEIVIGDDCSTDATGAVLDELARAHGSIRILRPHSNLGHNGRAMFLATLRHCDGDFVAMLDGDDYWTSADKLQRQLDFFSRNPDCMLCHHAVENVFEDGRVEPWASRIGEGESTAGFEALLPWHHIASPSPMVRQSVINFLPRWIHRSPFGDWPLYLIAADAGPIGYLPDILAAYRFHEGGAWTQSSAIERQQQVVDFFAATGGGLKRRRARALLGALIFHLLELASAYEDESSLVGLDSEPMPDMSSWDIADYRTMDLERPTWRFLQVALWFFDKVAGEYRTKNVWPISQARAALLFHLAELLSARQSAKAAIITALRSCQANPATFGMLASSKLSQDGRGAFKTPLVRPEPNA
jgi:glycosyltransferase involved in cell wall biosynthesis